MKPPPPPPATAAGALLAIVILGTGCTTTSTAPENTSPEGGTVIESPAMAEQLLGDRPLSLQWISWEHYGDATITKDKHGVMHLTGTQRNTEPANTDYLKIDGRITRVQEQSFTFDGVIEIQVSHILDGKPYRRTGEQQFRLYGNRGFWRLQDMVNTDGSTDYVDIYFDLQSARASNADWAN